MTPDNTSEGIFIVLLYSNILLLLCVCVGELLELSEAKMKQEI